ncbi:MAG: acetamidase/formamidase family protein [Terracidiphilus sp.]
MMNREIRIALLAGVIAFSRLCAAADLSGDWVATIATQRAPEYARVLLKDDGGKLSGTWGEFKMVGTLTGDKVDLALSDESDKPAGSLTGTLSGATISGSGTISMRGGRAGRVGMGGGGFGGGMGGTGSGGFGGGAAGQIEFTLARAALRPSKPRDISFVPTDFFATYSAANKPALTIFPGDVVHTWTADAGGVDANGVRHRGGDSNIGPFYVEGALPGDTLVVHLIKVRTNRPTAHQGSHLNANAATAAYLVGAKYDGSVDGQWTILPDKGIAVPTHPSEHMKSYSVPLKPMLGCISVAPPGDQQYRGGDLGPFGGNMDYNDNAEGTTLYFPVFHPGALLGMGDGHAAMGDGEVVGSGLETSMDVVFSVDVIPGDATAQVRAETKDYLIAFGVTGSVPESIQVATSELAKWIKKDYNLSDSEVAILFASTLKYDITELVDPRFNVAAKVPKSVLATMK